MSEALEPIWLGYHRLGGRFKVTHDEIEGGIAVLGHGAAEVAALFAQACNEARLKVLVLDMDGGVSEKISGYIDTYALPYFLHDALRIGDNANTHGQLIASAYSCALDLSFEQESVLNSVIQIIANERGVASPSSLSDLILSQSSQGISGRPVDKLKARLESLRTLNMMGEPNVVGSILQKSSVLDFSGAGQPEAAESAAALLIAKFLAIELGPSPVKPDIVILADAHRLFRARPVFRKSQRLLSTFVHASFPKMLTSESAYGLDEQFLDACAVKIVSSAVWNETSKGLILTPNMFMVRNHPYGYEEAFIPRHFEPKKGEVEGRVVDEGENADLIRIILENVQSFQDATRASLIAYLSTEFPSAEIEMTIDRLQDQGLVLIESKDVKGSPPIHTLSLTDKGKELLGRLK
jgi:hypothetical protein